MSRRKGDGAPVAERDKRSSLCPIEARLAAETANAEARTVDVVVYSGATVLRVPWDGDPYFLRFRVDARSVRLGRLNHGAPVLNTHRDWSVSDVLGVSQRGWIDDGKIKATIRFSKRADVQPYWQDVQDGVLCNISGGMQIYAREKAGVDEKTKFVIYEVTDWEPMEVSLAPVQADAEAQVLEAEFEQIEETMKTPNPSGGAATTPAPGAGGETTPAPAATLSPAAAGDSAGQLTAARAEGEQAGTQKERRRVAEIHKACLSVGLDMSFAQRLIDEGLSADEANKRILDHLAAEQAKAPTRSQLHVVRSEDETTRAGAVSALMHRADPKNHPPADAGRRFVGLSLVEISRELLRLKGVHPEGRSRSDVVNLALTTSDLPNVLANVANKFLVAGYGAGVRTFPAYARRRSLPDFKSVKEVKLSGAPSLLKVNEHGEIKYGKLDDSGETWALSSYARILPITRQAIINDDMDALSRIPMAFGRAAADLESDIVMGILTANAALSDGIALFHASHNNLIDKTLSLAGLGTGRAKMRKQTGLEGRPIALAPKFLLVPTDLETTAEQLVLLPIAPAEAGKANPFRGLLTLLVEPRLDSAPAAWYLVADNMQADGLVYGYLEGQEGVKTEVRNGFEVDGVEIKALHDFGAGVGDFVGLQKSTGANP